MKKIIFLLTILSFSSIATAENEAVYDTKSGSVEIPVLSVKGQTNSFSVTLHQQDTENLIFSVTDMEPNPVIDSSTNGATYDPETRTVIIPTVFVLEEGNQTVTSYSVELKLTDESTFEVSQLEPILGLSSNVFNSVQSDPLSYTKSAKVASKRCSGNPSQNIDEARRNFKSKCGEPWNDQEGHVCDYKPDGYHCNGHVSSTLETHASPEDGQWKWCWSFPLRNSEAAAKRQFKESCHREYGNRGDDCGKLLPGRWACRGLIEYFTITIVAEPLIPLSDVTSVYVGGGKWCTTNVGFADIKDAKDGFGGVCGRPYNDQQGDYCSWISWVDRYQTDKKGGWRCYGVVR